MTAIVLRTPRLLLDAVRPDDTDAVLEYCNDPALQGYIPVPVPYTRESAEGYTGGYAPRAPLLWAIRESGQLVGVIELKVHELASAELGYWLGKPHRNRGIMTEAAKAVVEFGLDPVGGNLEHIDWYAVVGNIGSATVARNAGFRYEGLRRRALPHRDRRLDAWAASLLRDDERTPQPGWPL